MGSGLKSSFELQHAMNQLDDDGGHRLLRQQAGNLSLELVGERRHERAGIA